MDYTPVEVEVCSWTVLSDSHQRHVVPMRLALYGKPPRRTTHPASCIYLFKPTAASADSCGRGPYVHHRV